MIGAILDDRLVEARLDNQGYWNKARQCLPVQGSTAPRARLDRDDRSSAHRYPEQGSTGMIGAILDDRLVGARVDQGHYGARIDTACWSRAQQHVEHFSTGMIRAVLYDSLVEERLDNQEHWSNARQCLSQQGSTAPAARLDRDNRSSALRLVGLEQGSITKGTGARLNSVCRGRAQRPLEPCSTGMIEKKTIKFSCFFRFWYFKYAILFSLYFLPRFCLLVNKIHDVVNNQIRSSTRLASLDILTTFMK